MVDPVMPFVISIGVVRAGTKDNIIPDIAEMQGTLRSLDEKTRGIAKAKVKRVAAGVCSTFGARAEVTFKEDAYPVTINDHRVTNAAAGVLRKMPGTRVKWIEPVMATEDFSRFLQRVPGMFYFLGTRNVKKGCVYPNHSSRFKVDEDVLKYGAASLAELAADFSKP